MKGRPPSLTPRGRAFAVGGGLLLGLGVVTGSWHAAALGVIALSALSVAYLRFYPTSVMIWRRHLELQWSVQRQEGAPDLDAGFVVGRPFTLEVTLRNLSPRPLGRARVRVFAASALEAPPVLACELDARRDVRMAGEILPRRVGTWHLHGAAVELSDALGLAAVEAYFPNSIAFKVLPRPQLRTARLKPRPTAGAPDDRVGLHTLRRRGLGGDLRELREHMPGDPFKQIAWKATARTGQLMVRDLDRETLQTHWLLVDLGPSMRRGRPGATKLDQAIDLAAGYARAALEAGDRVGLCTYDGRIVAEVKPNDGPVHRLRLYEPLLEATAPVDEDLTELTDSELIAQVGAYLLHQEGVKTRLDAAPRIDDPSWTWLASSPAGELYDLRLLFRAVESALAGKAILAERIRAQNHDLARLRLYCRLRGIELPHRRASEAGRRARGLARALERAAAGRGAQRILVLSDLEGLDGDLGEVARALKLARRRGHHLTCAAPSSRMGRLDELDDDRLSEIASWEAERRERAAIRRVAALGLRVVPIAGDALGPSADLRAA